jgi:hypothetical protein
MLRHHLAITLSAGSIWTVRAAPMPHGFRIIQPFDFHGLTLEDSDYLRQLEEVRAYYWRIPNDDLLKGFRARTGMAAPGGNFAGWYTADAGHAGKKFTGYVNINPKSSQISRKTAAVGKQSN